MSWFTYLKGFEIGASYQEIIAVYGTIWYTYYTPKKWGIRPSLNKTHVSLQVERTPVSSGNNKPVSTVKIVGCRTETVNPPQAAPKADSPE